MSVVVNEFEVVPAAGEQAPAPAPQETSEAPPVSLPREIDRVLRERAERRLRLEAD